MSKNREELIRNISAIKCGHKVHSHCHECISDFILADRKRIVEPLMKLFRENYFVGSRAGGVSTIQKAINQTLKLSGMEES